MYSYLHVIIESVILTWTFIFSTVRQLAYLATNNNRNTIGNSTWWGNIWFYLVVTWFLLGFYLVFIWFLRIAGIAKSKHHLLSIWVILSCFHWLNDGEPLCYILRKIYDCTKRHPWKILKLGYAFEELWILLKNYGSFWRTMDPFEDCGTLNAWQWCIFKSFTK